MYNDKMMSTLSSPVRDDIENEERQIDLSGVFPAVKAEWKTILKFALVPAVLTLVITLMMRTVYTAEASFLPPNSMSSSANLLPSALLGQIGGGASSALGGLKDPTLIYIGILNSRAVADDLIQRFDLAKVYNTKKLSKTEKALWKRSKFTSTKNTITTISVEDYDPKRAANIANAYLDELHKQNNRLALTEAAQKRAFFQQQVENEKNALADAEVALAQTQQKTGILQPLPQAQLQMETIAQTQAEIAIREVQLASLSQAATDQNPEVVRLRSEIAGLREQMRKLERSSTSTGDGDIQVPTAKVPELTLIYLRKARDVKYHEELYSLLLRQYVSANLDEARSAPLLQVVDYATVPDTKSGPHRGLLTALAFVLGAMAGCVWAVMRQRKLPPTP